MQQLLASDLELVVVNGFLFVPLLFDPSVAAEIEATHSLTDQGSARGSPPGDELLLVNGRHFIKTLSLPSLLEQFANLHPDAYRQLRDDFLNKRLGFVLNREEISLDEKLQTIVFEIMPHFLRRADRIWGRKKPGNEELLALICQKFYIPPKYKRLRERLDNPELLRKLLAYLDNLAVTVEPIREGRIRVQELRRWFYQAISAQILQKEKDRVRQKIARDEQLSKHQRQKGEVLLFLAAKGSLEIEGFGFFRIGKSGEYVIYKRTGEYALKDYYGRPYLFPDCRVAIATAGRLRPLVLEKYKHPFLRRHAPGQDICLQHFTPPPAFNATAAVTALNEGVNALFYGYNYRRRNGYHSLDRLPLEERLVDFEDYRIDPDHPKISSGQVEIKNAYL
ncbi:MAG: hypothetical protein ACOZF2_03780 [Thermodesulfobacteriota bacterium]